MKEGVKILGIVAVIVLVYHYFFRSIAPATSAARGSSSSKDDVLSEVGNTDPDLGQDNTDSFVQRIPLGDSSTEVATTHAEGQDNQMSIASRNSVSVLR